MMPDLEERILSALSKRNYTPLKPKALAQRVGVAGDDYAAFRRVLRELVDRGRVEMGKNHTIRPAAARHHHRHVPQVRLRHQAGSARTRSMGTWAPNHRLSRERRGRVPGGGCS